MTLAVLLFAGRAQAASKPHMVSFGKWTAIKWCVGTSEAKCIDLKGRSLYVDSRMKEFTLGAAHEITERLFVIRRAFRINDSLPAEAVSSPRWVWQRGGWLLVDRMTGHVSAISLPEFDSYYSVASWYRDYVAYCGVSDDGKKLFAVVYQVGRRKPVLKKPLGETAEDDMPDSECPAPAWERRPARVTFEADENQKLTYAVRGHAVDLVGGADDEEGEKASK
ncbi:MAG TPA: hypothetical protein VHS34_14505 [Terriglobales bacterium]|jgi:hypothetical protein|nr:hypothetical protein [Terriglobales bacterium]